MAQSKTTNADPTRATRESKTVAELMNAEKFYPSIVPLYVRFWLERYVERGDRELGSYALDEERDLMDMARLVYDVLESKYLDTDEHEFPAEARDYMSWFLWRLAQDADIQIWNYPEAAIAALVPLIDCSETCTGGSTNLKALELAIEALTTRRERRHFLKTEEEGDESKDECDWYAARKLSRTLASTRTDAETRRKLGAALVELAALTSTHVDHPAIVARAAEVMFEAVADAEADTPAARTYRLINELLEGLPDAPEAEKGDAGR
jgi:hypothetical protein